MAERRFSLCRFLRRKKKKEGPETAPAQQPEEAEQPQPLQEDPGRERTQEQDRARGHFRRAAQACLTSLAIRRRKTRITPTEVLAQPDPTPSELKAHPEVGTASTDGTANCDSAVTDDGTNSNMALPELSTEADGATTEGMADTESTPVQRLPDAPSRDVLGDGAVSAQEATEPDRDTEQRPPSVSQMAWVKEEEEEERADVAPAQQPEEVDQPQPLQEGQDSGADTDSRPAQSGNDALPADVSEENGVSDAKQVPAFVRNVHQRLTASTTPEEKLLAEFLRVTDEHPADAVVTLLCCASSCDRAAAIMWRTITSSGRTVVKVLPELLCVMEDWPMHSMSTSDGDKTDVFALAATRVIWETLQMFWFTESLIEYSPRLLMALLFQVLISTEQTPEEVDTFWRGCREQHNLPTQPNRFAVLTIKALLCHLECEEVVVSMERKRGWDTLLSADTHHYAVGLLAREMRRVSSPLCSRITLHLLELLSREEPHLEVFTVAFLVEVLDGLDMSDWGGSILQSLSRHLRSECPERRRLALRGLLVLSQDPVMADGVQSLTQSLTELLWDADGELVWMALSIFINEVQDRGIPISTPTALELAEALQTLFGYDNIHVQLLSVHLFRRVLKLVVEEGKQPLQTHVIQSLLPLFFLSHDENEHLADASWEVLIRALRFLKRRDLKNLLEADKPWRFCDCLVESEKKRVVEFMWQALPHLESPQEPLREAALKFIGIAAKYLRKGQEEDELITEVIIDTLQGMTADSPAISRLAAETLKIIKDVHKPKPKPTPKSKSTRFR
ncbi:maestro heat-like repeat-containing protein family member 6 isoform X2 [Pipra filicauda]|uniref:Maestro heat-like repeat-containing protein family member 6 isoform X2 n=1 Tax=Pipra filicauda TaxID=649802 RepID=A0A7R5KQN1_9PASS|nr:maestro heat-like repeat-containing protein family member 6 isoform X2 [Pipra filicauda]